MGGGLRFTFVNSCRLTKDQFKIEGVQIFHLRVLELKKKKYVNGNPECRTWKDMSLSLGKIM